MTVEATKDQYYSREEIVHLLDKGTLIIDGDSDLVSFVALALEFMPKEAVDFIIAYCSIAVDTRSVIVNENVWGICEAIEPNECYWITLSLKLFQQSPIMIVETILHEFSHAVLKHDENSDKQKGEKEVCDLLKKWIDDYG